jgi:RNA polymerase sigma-70 factor (sigma-E family)
VWPYRVRRAFDGPFVRFLTSPRSITRSCSYVVPSTSIDPKANDPNRIVFQCREGCNEPAGSLVHAAMVTEELATAVATEHERSADVPISFEDLFHTERTRLFRALCVLTGNQAEAEDLAQDAFVRVWSTWDRVGAMNDPTGYLYRTAMNGARSRYRRSVLALKRQLRPREDRDELSMADDRVELARSLARLTHKQRAAIVLLDLLELSSEEAATVLGISPGTVRTQASRGRAELRRQAGENDG